MEFLENEIAKKAKSVFDFAYIKALENDLKIIRAEKDKLYEIDNQGNKTFIKTIKTYKVKEKSFMI